MGQIQQSYAWVGKATSTHTGQKTAHEASDLSDSTWEPQCIASYTDERCHGAKVKPNTSTACKRCAGIVLLYLTQVERSALAVPFKREVDSLKGAQRSRRMVKAAENKTQEKAGGRV